MWIVEPSKGTNPMDEGKGLYHKRGRRPRSSESTSKSESKSDSETIYRGRDCGRGYLINQMYRYSSW